MRLIFRKYNAHYSVGNIAEFEGDNIFVPDRKDIIVIPACTSGKVISRAIHYDIENL